MINFNGVLKAIGVLLAAALWMGFLVLFQLFPIIGFISIGIILFLILCVVCSNDSF